RGNIIDLLAHPATEDIDELLNQRWDIFFGASEVAEAGWETRSVGSRGRCETRPELPSPRDPGSSRPLAERRRDAFGRFLSVRTLVLAGHAAIWAATLGECRP